MANIRALLQATFVLLAVSLLTRLAQADHRSDRMRVMAAAEPPQRPSNFADLDELNNYLEELRQYYTIIGRPRWVLLCCILEFYEIIL